MERIEDYEGFCKAFNEDKVESKKDAKLLLFIQDWIIRVLNFVEEDTMDYSLKRLLHQSSEKIINGAIKKDVLSNIIDNSEMAFRYLSDNMREKIVRENVQMPVYKVKEVNGYGLNWLSRQAGKTVKEKVSSAGNSIMAVQRRMSFDTAENRLFIAFAREMYEQLNIKLENMPDILMPKEEEELRDELASFLLRSDIQEVRRWENLPPNNTLLSDQNYKKIWKAWNELKKIDEHIENDMNLIENRLASIFFIELLVYCRNVLRIPQEPIEVEYDEYKIYLCEQDVHCLDLKGNIVVIKKGDNFVIASTNKGEVKAEFKNKVLEISVDGKKTSTYEISQNNFFSCIKLFISKTGIYIPENIPHENKIVMKKQKDVVIDLFSTHPSYIFNGNKKGKLSARILQQKYFSEDIDGDKRDYYIPCDSTNAIKMIPDVTETYSIPLAVDNGSMNQMKRLMHMMEEHILTDSLTYVFPDAYNDFQLSMVHKAAKMVYRKVRNVPLSIGAAFKYQSTEDFSKKFNPGDFLLVLDLIDDELTFTLVSGVFDKDIQQDISEYKGIVWERHPTSTRVYKRYINDNIIDKLTKLGCAKPEKLYKLLGIEGLKDETNQLSIFDGRDWFELDDNVQKIIEEINLNVTDEVANFLAKNRSIVKDSRVHILSVVDNLLYKGNIPFIKMSKQDILEGCYNLQKLEDRTAEPLWHDHLPALAIKMMYGKFDLIKNARVVPKFNKKQSIPINGTFTLPKNCFDYHFRLVQDENAREMRYEAVIKNPAFPLRRDTECNLIMTYEYGAEEPYELIFVPKDKEKAEFTEAKVQWFPLDKYSIKDLESPEFPAKLSWNELKKYGKPGENTVNVYDALKEQYELINDGYITCDISNTNIRTNSKGNRFGEFKLETSSGEVVNVAWNEAVWEKGAPRVDKISTISFVLTEDSRSNNNPRYRIRDLNAAKTGSNLWFINRRGANQCIVYFDEYDGESRELSIIDRNFDNPELFDTSVNDISFEVDTFSNGSLVAKNIHDERMPVEKRYFAKGLHAGNTPPKFFINPYYSKWTRVLFANNRSLTEEGCPLDFQQDFVHTVKKWVDLFYQYEDPEDRKKLFALLSLAAYDIGKDYYDVANTYLQMYREGDIDIPYEIGCALCDLSNDMQRELFDAILRDVNEDHKVIGILSKAIWHNERFIFNIDLNLILNTYLPKAIDYIGASIKRVKRINLKDVGSCLEFILGVLRLRSLNNDMINSNYLSLNNNKMRKLYKYIELMIDNNIYIKSFLKLEIASKGMYENICDLLYVLLVYVTGHNTEGEIRISGINTDE